MIGHVAGLDIGSTKVCCLIADVHEDGRTHVVGYGKEPCKGLRKGSIVDMDDASRSIQRCVSQAERMCEREVSDVTVGISGEHITMHGGVGKLTLTPSAREITGDDVRRVVDNSRDISIPPDQEILDVIPCSYKVDDRNGVVHPVGLLGSKLEVHTQIVVGGSTVVQNLARAVEKAGLRVGEMILQPLAAGQALLEESERQVGVALVDIGGHNCDVTVFAEGVLQYYGTLPIGGHHVTSDVSKLLRTSVEEAERLKLECGTVLYENIPPEDAVEVRQLGNPDGRRFPRRMLAEIMQSRMWEMLTMVRSHLERCDRLSLLPGGVVLAGGGCGLTGLTALASDMLGKMPVRVGLPKGLDGMDATTRGSDMALAAGLAQLAAMAMRQDENGEQRGDWLRTIRRKWFNASR